MQIYLKTPFKRVVVCTKYCDKFFNKHTDLMLCIPQILKFDNATHFFHEMHNTNMQLCTCG